MGAPLTLRKGEGMRHREWPPSVPFRSRLAAFRRELQAALDERSPAGAFQPRFPVTVRLSLDELATLLPPAEERLLAHLRTRTPLGSLVRAPSYRSRFRLNATLQQLLSRVQVYCGARARHALMQGYDRPGHCHRRRVGRPRALIPRERLPPLLLWATAPVVVLGDRVLVVRRGLLTRRPAAAGLALLLPPRQPGLPDFPRRRRTPVGTGAPSWSELLSRAAPWLGT
jgi:hypothetical protein